MKISVVIPLYNKRDTILRAMHSISNQTVLPDEIIVVNDGSTDGSEQVVAQLGHSLIKLVNQSNQGVSAARNRGIAEAKYEWIAFLDADDEWLPGFLVTIKELSNKYSDCSVLATSYYLHDLQGERMPITLRRLPFNHDDGILQNYFEVAAHSHPPIWSGAVVIKKDLLRKVGGFPLNIHSGEDLVTWARLACLSNIGYSMIPQSVFWINPPTVIDRRKNPIKGVDLVSEALNELKNHCHTHSKKHICQYIGLWHKMRASILIRLTESKTDAFKEIIKSIIVYPWQLRIYFYLFLLFIPRRLVYNVFKK